MKQVTGIIIDYFAARDIYARAVPAELSVISNLRADHRLAFCLDEEEAFQADPHAVNAFGNVEPLFCKCDDAFYDQCEALSAQIAEHRFLGESRTQLHIAAHARAHGLGVLSGHFSHFYVTVAECCQQVGVHCWDTGSFFPDLVNVQFV